MVAPKHKTFGKKRYVFQDEAFHKTDATKKKASLKKKGFNVREIKTPTRHNPNKRTLYIRKKTK